MTDHYNAFEMSPVPAPGPDAVAPELFRGIYGMPAFVTIPTTDLAASVEFWTRGLGFFELFGVPGRIVHLRRWVFQDVLLVPGETAQETAPGLRVSFACVLGQIEPLVAACRAWGPGTVGGPSGAAWDPRGGGSLAPGDVRVVFTAAKPYEPGSVEAATLAEMGIRPPADTAEVGGGVDAG